jgi:hypothetical protein
VPAQLVGVGPELEVLEPVEVRDRVASIARAVADRYEPIDSAVPVGGGESGPTTGSLATRDA